MIIEDGLKTYLRGELGTQRVYFAKAESSALSDGLPYSVIYRIAASPTSSHTGPSPTISRRYQVSTFGRSQHATAAMADRVRRALDGFQGTVSDGLSPQTTMYVSSSLWQGEMQQYNETSERHQFANDFEIKFREE